MLLALIVAFILIAFIDLTPLIVQRKWRAVIAFLVVFVIALTLAILQVCNIQVPSIMYAWGDLIRWLGMGYKP